MEKLLNDITEMNCKDGKLYLAATMDCFDGAIVGMSINKTSGQNCADNPAKRLSIRYGKTKGMSAHSDHGSQYTSNLFRGYLKAEGARQSMGRTGSCFDNARMESFLLP